MYDLKNASAAEVLLTVGELHDANLSGADLSGANLNGMSLRGANLSDANLSNANLSNADLSGANLSGANLHDIKLVKTTMVGTKAFNANFDRALLMNCVCRDSSFCGSVFRAANIVNLQGWRVSLRDIEAVSSAWIDCCLQQSIFNGADLRNSRFRKCDLSGSQLRSLRLERAQLEEVKLQAAICELPLPKELLASILLQSGLEKSQLSDSDWDKCLSDRKLINQAIRDSGLIRV